MSYGNQGPFENAPKSGGSNIMFLVMLFVAGFVVMNMLRQQISESPDNSLPGPSTERSDYEPVDFQRGENGARQNSETKGGIYGSEQAERPAAHPNAGDWEMEDVKTKKSQSTANSPVESKRSDNGDWSMEQVPTRAKEKPTFDLSNSSSKQPKPVSKSTKKGDWEFEEVDKKK